jgi:type II secretory pathway component PulF
VNEEATDSANQLSPAAAEAVLERVAAVAGAQMPLAAGLRAAAAEADSRPLARALRSLAEQLDRGRSLDDCLAAASRKLPSHLTGLIRAAARTGELGPVMAEWFENRQAARQHWRAVVSAVAYPALSLALAGLVFVLFATLVVPPFQQMVEDFGLTLPFNTRAVFWLSDAGAKIFATCVGVGAVSLIVLRLVGGRAGWSWLMTNLPLIGDSWHWIGVAEMLRALSLLVEHRVPLAEALRLTAGGISDGYVASQCSRLAASVEKGTSLTMSLVNLRTLPVSIVPLVHWGERHNTLAEGLRSAAEMIEGRLKFRTGLLAQVIPPVIFLLVGIMVLSLVGMIAGTMVRIIQGLV